MKRPIYFEDLSMLPRTKTDTYYSSLQSLIFACCALTFFSVACGRKSSESSLNDFSGPQLMGHGMDAKSVALTFDDGPGPRTSELSEYLRSEGIRATFFLEGDRAIQYPDVIRQLQEDGHLVANHSYTHPRMTQSVDPVEEVRKTDRLIEEYVDQGHFLFRAPYGDWNGRVAAILNNAGLTKYVGSVFWDIGGERISRGNGTLSAAADWACWSNGDSISKCLDGYLNETRELNRGIVLMHDVHSRTVDMAKLYVQQLKQENYEFIRTDEAPTIAAALAKRSRIADKSKVPPAPPACSTFDC